MRPAPSIRALLATGLAAAGLVGQAGAGAAAGAAAGERGRVSGLHADLGSGRRTRLQHLEELLDVVAHREETLRAFISLRAEEARSEVMAADSLRARMVALPLDGVLVAVKDNVEQMGARTSAGSRQLARIAGPAIDATVVSRLRGAGGVMLGTTNMDTWARGVRGVSEVRGQTANPWDETRNAGGSSAGSAAAVAAGMADVAVGTDTCGSLRYPASSVGIFSLRPTVGLVSRAGVVPLSPTQDVVGPMAVHPDDLEALLDVLSAGPDPRDPLTFSAPGVLPGAPLGRPLRVGVLAGLGRVNPAVLAALRSHGVELVDAGRLPAAVSSAANVIDDESLPARRLYLAWRARSVTEVRGPDPWLVGGLAVTDPKGYRRRLGSQQQARRSISALMDRLGVDALAMPTTIAPPVRLGQQQPNGNCHVSATTGLPALTLPGGPGGSGGVPPVGVDLVGRQWSERTLLALARAV